MIQLFEAIRGIPRVFTVFETLHKVIAVFSHRVGTGNSQIIYGTFISVFYFICFILGSRLGFQTM